jgi:hypothetical protein
VGAFLKKPDKLIAEEAKARAAAAAAAAASASPAAADGEGAADGAAAAAAAAAGGGEGGGEDAASHLYEVGTFAQVGRGGGKRGSSSFVLECVLLRGAHGPQPARFPAALSCPRALAPNLGAGRRGPARPARFGPLVASASIRPPLDAPTPRSTPFCRATPPTLRSCCCSATGG